MKIYTYVHSLKKVAKYKSTKLFEQEKDSGFDEGLLLTLKQLAVSSQVSLSIFRAQ